MKKFMMKFLRRSLYVLLTLCLLSILALSFIFYTDTGLQWALKSANKLTHRQLSYSDVTGTLGSGISAQSITYQNPGISIHAANAKIKLNPWALLIKTVSVKQFTADSIQIVSSSNPNLSPSPSEKLKEKSTPFRLPLSIKLSSLNVKKLNFDNKNFQAVFSRLTGKIDLSPQADTTHFHINTAWENLKLTRQHDSIELTNSKFIGSGSLKNYSGQFVSSITFIREANPPQQLDAELAFKGSEKSITFKTFKLKSTIGIITGYAQLKWLPSLQWDIKIDCAHLQKQLSKQLETIVNFQMRSQGQQDKKGLSGFVTLKKLTASVNGEPLAGAVELTFSPHKFSFENTYLRTQDIQLKVSGGLDKYWNLKWDLNIPHLDHLFNIGHGSILSSGKITGSEIKPEIIAELQASNIDSFGLILNNLQASVNIKPEATSYIQINADKLQYANIKMDKLSINTLGDLHSNTLHLTLNSSDYNLSASLQGQFRQKFWIGKITRFVLQQPQVGTWQMAKPSELQLGQNPKDSKDQAFVIQLKNLCLANQEQSFCASVDKSGQYFSLQAQLRKLKFSNLLTALLDKDAGAITVADSLVNLNLNYHNGKNPEGLLDGEITPGSVSFSDNGQIQITRIIQSKLNAELKNNILKAVANVRLSQSQALRANLTVTHLNQTAANQSLQGSISLNYHDLSLLTKFFPLIEQVRGSIKGNLTIGGTSANPRISGNLNFANGFMSLPSYGLDLRNIFLTASGNQTGQINIDGHLNSGGGNLNLRGHFDPLASGMPAVLNLTGSNVLVMNSPAYKFYASPDLNIRKTFHKIVVNGSIKIPKGLIAPTDFGSGGVSLSQDVRFAHDTQKVSKYLITGDIKLLAGKDIKVDVVGLTGKARGELELFYNSAANSTATGTFGIIDGEFNAYGQKLTLETGKLIYNSSPLDNPGLEVAAYKMITTQATAINSTLGESFSMPDNSGRGGQLKVGVNVLGTVRQYKVALFSDPPVYSQSDILSLILTGQTANNISRNNAQLLLRAASSMNLGGNSISNITQQLKQTFGLDELGIADQSSYDKAGDVTSTTSLVLGKHVTPRLFVSYSIGILDPISTFKASYLLTKNWSLQADTGSNGSGADVFYSIER